MPGNRHVVLNQTDRLSGLTVRDAERILGAPIDVEVPRSSAVLLASNRGIPSSTTTCGIRRPRRFVPS